MTNDPSNQVLPLEAEGVQPGFDIVLRGYDRGQVDRQVGWLEEQLGATDRQVQALTEAVRRAEHDTVEARRQAEKSASELARGRPTFEALGERIATMLRLAEEEAEEYRRTGRADIERARGEWATELAASQHALEEQRRAAEKQVEALVAQARHDAERIVTDARRSAAETTGAAQRQVEAMSRQRDAIHQELVRVQERFAAVMGGAIDVTDQRGESAESPSTSTSTPTDTASSHSAAPGTGSPPTSAQSGPAATEPTT